MEKELKRGPKPLLGEMFLRQSLITEAQLKDAIKRQSQTGGHIGSILREMGYLNDESLLKLLSEQLETPPVNLFETKVPADTLKLLPFEKIRSFRVLPFKLMGVKVYLAMVNPKDINTIQDMEFMLGREVEPYVVPYYQMDKAISYFEKEGYGEKPFEGDYLKAKTLEEETEEEIPHAESMGTDIFTLLKLVGDYNATDLLITAGVSPSLRINNELKRLTMPPLTSQQVEELAYRVLTKEQKAEFEVEKEIDFSISLKGTGRFRINLYRQRNSISLAARYLIENIPTLRELHLPEWLSDFAVKSQGLILITGPSGHGKTTTMAALLDIINSNKRCNIVTLEDPIEYLHKHKKSNINQREIGIDTESFAAGLKHILRQDPDVIVIGEMRDPESISIALTAAETGHLVISTLHSMNTTTAIDRIVDIFPANQQHQVRMQFADIFLVVFGQRLVPKKDGEGLIPAYEKITNSFRVRNLLREGKSHNLRSLMQVAAVDMSSIDYSLAMLCLEGKIKFEDGLKFSDNQQYYEEMVRSGNILAAKWL
ncbi:MAG: PilT/PilU family type 4a pilus ATPase [Nitrospirae bacterium]|nr:PilT/PilU family type 4a pilus ATPase [Nitrospirota bacterium]